MSHTTTDAPSLPAAWYRDPSGRHERRWWDGAEWTDRVADGEVEATDPPVRSAAAVEAPAGVAGAGGTDGGTEDGPAEDPLGGFDQLRPTKRRHLTAEDPDDGSDLSKAKVAAWIGVAVAVVLALGWGLHNYRTADQWRDRSEALEAELVTSESNADAVEQALGNAASQRARMEDGQQFFTELEGAARATADQLRACANVLNDLLTQVAGGGDPVALIDRANATCGQAAANGEALIALLDQLA